MLSGYPPFPGNDHKEIIKNVMKKELKFTHDEFKNSSEESKNLIRKFLKKDPDQRITLADALNDPWMKETTLDLGLKLDISSHKQIIAKLGSYAKTNLFTKAIKLCMSKIYEQTNVTELQKKFMEMDTNHNGVLEPDEFSNVMKHFGFEDSAIAQMIKSLDLNGDGQIEYSEFLAGCGSFDKANM